MNPTKKARKTHVFRTAQDRRAEIISAALRCLEKDGYAKLTARRIAENSGISLGHITYNFKNMREVLVEAYRHASLKLARATRQNLTKSSKQPVAQLRSFLNAGFKQKFLQHEYLRVRVDLWSAALAYDEIAAVERELYQSYRLKLMALLRAVAADCNSSPKPVAMLADTIMATLDGLWLDWGRRHDKAAIRNGLGGCISLVEAAFRGQSVAVGNLVAGK